MITAKIKSAERAQVTGRLTQWDVGQTIQVEGLSVSGVAYARMSVLRKSYSTLTVECSQSEGILTVDVPDVLLTSSGTLSVAIVDDTEDEALAVARFEVPIEPAAKPADYVPGSPALVTIEALRRRIELAESDASSAVSQASQALTDAETAYARAMEAAESAESTDSLVLANEAIRVSAESERESAEELRKSAEGERQSMEESRKADEASRSSAEQARAESEAARVQAEKSRALAEQSRVAAENSRVQAESMRVAAEQARDDDWTSLRSDMVSSFNADQSTRAQLFQDAQDSRDAEFGASMGVYDTNIETAVQKAELAASNANAAAANAEAHAGNYLRGEESGALVHVDDAWPSPVRGLKVYGKSEQFTTTGKNLIDITKFPFVTANGDGTFTVNNVSGNRLDDNNVITLNLPSGSYVFSYRMKSNVGSNFRFDLKVGDGSWVNIYKESTGEYLDYSHAFILDSNSSVSFCINAAVAVEVASSKNVVVAWMQLELGSTATSYEPYTGGKPSPSPDYPQEIKSIGAADVVTYGKNLVKLTDGSTNQYGVSCSIVNGIVSLSGTSGNEIPFGIMFPESNISEILVPGGTYTASINGKSNSSYIQCNYINKYGNEVQLFSLGGNSSVSKHTFTVDEYMQTNILFVGISGGKPTVSDRFTFQIELGTAATPYSPYTGSTTPVSLTAEDGTVYELRSLPNGTRDEVGIVDGRWVLKKRAMRKTISALTNANRYQGRTDAYCIQAPILDVTADIHSIIESMQVHSNIGAPKRQPVFAEGGEYGISLSHMSPENVYICIEGFTSLQEYKDYVAEHPIELIYPIAEQTIDLGPADTPLLPETVSNVWAVSEPSTEIDVTYERDVTVAYQQLEQAIASITA